MSDFPHLHLSDISCHCQGLYNHFSSDLLKCFPFYRFSFPLLFPFFSVFPFPFLLPLLLRKYFLHPYKLCHLLPINCLPVLLRHYYIAASSSPSPDKKRLKYWKLHYKGFFRRMYCLNRPTLYLLRPAPDLPF